MTSPTLLKTWRRDYLPLRDSDEHPVICAACENGATVQAKIDSGTIYALTDCCRCSAIDEEMHVYTLEDLPREEGR